MGITASGLTAYYMFRAILLTFFGASRVPEAHASRVHEAPLSMTAVLGILAFGSLTVGFLGLPDVWREWLGVRAPFYDFLAPMFAPGAEVHETRAIELGLMAIAVFVAAAGAIAAWLRYGRSRDPRADGTTGAIRQLVGQGYYFDAFYDGVVVRSLDWISESVLARGTEVALARITLTAPAATARAASSLFARLQSGNVHTQCVLRIGGPRHHALVERNACLSSSRRWSWSRSPRWVRS